MKAPYRRNRSLAASIVIQRLARGRKSRCMIDGAMMRHGVWIAAIVDLPAHGADDIMFAFRAGSGVTAFGLIAIGVRVYGIWRLRRHLGLALDIVPQGDAQAPIIVPSPLDEWRPLQAGLCK
jgi:hypothetical protein